ncbi:PAS domain-containing protein [Halopelagius longus]|uniref:histidine kinase n=1 Tax=Halopelagius longus TaxID=1236180 RepID=A0A1H0YNS0_9EURY|nr:PAS domain-containing protein [Halopelagius longus]RDI72579.1 PAS domain-containing sensor histidine kinase [Halopelagius longus]SDQ16496.1 Signal transduction histidine kinase [Halopelagius longus]
MASALSLPERGFDDLPTEVAIVDSRGDIVYTNRAWRQFAEDNGYDGPDDFRDVNYLAVCEEFRDESEEAGRVADGIRDVLDGESDGFRLDYPCHSPTERRWFLLRAVPFEGEDGDRYALLMHLDITDRKLAELRLEERNRQLVSIAGVLSEDIRPPLSAAVRASEMLAESGGDEAWRLAQILHQIDAIVQTGTVLAENAPSLEFESVELRDVAESVWHRVEPGDASFLVVDSRAFLADRELLSYLLENLLATAVVRAGDAVRVRVGTAAEGFYVSDDGTDVAHQYETMFDSATSELEGETYSLATVARVAGIHGWDVKVGESDMGGTCVTVSGVTWV